MLFALANAEVEISEELVAKSALLTRAVADSACGDGEAYPLRDLPRRQLDAWLRADSDTTALPTMLQNIEVRTHAVFAAA